LEAAFQVSRHSISQLPDVQQITRGLDENEAAGLSLLLALVFPQARYRKADAAGAAGRRAVRLGYPGNSISPSTRCRAGDAEPIFAAGANGQRANPWDDVLR